MRYFRFMFLLAVVSIAGVVNAQSDPLPMGEADKYFCPILAVPPTFAKSELASKPEIEIRVSGTANDVGVLEFPEFSPLEGNVSFVQAIKGVLSFWRFRPAAMRTSCKPRCSPSLVFAERWRA